MTWDALAWGRFVGLLGTVAALSAACAEGEQFSVSGGGEPSSVTSGPGSTNVSTGTGGTGGSGASTSTTTGMGGSGGFDDNCSEDPCKLTLPQCGCPPGDRCALQPGAVPERVCAPDGDKAIGEECNGDCSAGALCISLGAMPNPVSLCRKHCESDAECSNPGGLCVLSLNNSDELFCSENCLPDSNAGCDAAAKCAIAQEPDGLQRYFTVCANPGPGTQGSACAGNIDDCAATFTCVNDGTSDFCAKYCQVNNPSCPVGTQCFSLAEPQVINNVEYGVCAPL